MNESVDKTNVIITSAFYGFFITILIFFVGHLSNSDRTFMPESSSYGYYSGASKVLWGNYKCAFGDRHEIKTEGISAYNFGNQKLSINQMLGDTFGHFPIIALIGLILTAVISTIWIINVDNNKFKEIK